METGAIYQLSGPALPWLWPGLALAGLACLAAAIFLRRVYLLWPGLILVVIGAGFERDITLIVGGALASLGVWGCIRP